MFIIANSETHYGRGEPPSGIQSRFREIFSLIKQFSPTPMVYAWTDEDYIWDIPLGEEHLTRFFDQYRINFEDTNTNEWITIRSPQDLETQKSRLNQEGVYGYITTKDDPAPDGDLGFGWSPHPGSTKVEIKEIDDLWADWYENYGRY